MVRYFITVVFLSLLCFTSQAIQQCSSDVCKLPKCFCSGTKIPGNLLSSEVPQIVMISFQGAVTERLVDNYLQTLFRDRVNPNKCPLTSTFFVQDEYTHYPLVNKLFGMNQEIGIFGGLKAESKPESLGDWSMQIEGQKKNLHLKAGIPLENLNGYRLFGNWNPGGDTQYQALQTAQLSYDSSLRCADTKFWPYTFDYKTTQGCPVPVCPTGSHPGYWEVPITYFYDKSGIPCAYMDGCRGVKDEDDAYNLLLNNFLTHYNNTRSPFPMFFHATWFERYNYTLPAVLKFMDVLSNIKDVYVVSMNQTIEWIKQPTKLSAISKFKPWSC